MKFHRMEFLPEQNHIKIARMAGLNGFGMTRGEVAQKIVKHKRRTHARSPPLVRPRTRCITFPISSPDGNTGFVGLTIAAEEHALKYLREPNKKVHIAANTILVIDYPLRQPVELKLGNSPVGGFSYKDLIRFVGSAYRMLYKREAETTILPVENMRDRYPGCHLSNRAPTDGEFGIWGHDIGDLQLCRVVHDLAKNKLYLGIES